MTVFKPSRPFAGSLLAAGVLMVACSSSSSSNNSGGDGGDGDAGPSSDAAIDTTSAGDAATGDANPSDAGTIAPKPLPATITGFTVVGQSPAGSLRCDTDGTCYKNTTSRSNLTGTANAGDGIYKLPPNGSTFALIGDATTPPTGPMNGLITGLTLDGHGNVFACGTAPGGSAGSVPYQLAAGTSTWMPIGTGIGNVRNVVCGEALIHDGSTLFVGDVGLWKLPAGQTTWMDDGSATSGSGIVITVPYKGDVYVGTGGGAADFVYVRKAAAAAFVTVANGVRTLQHLAVDSAGNLLGHTYGPLGGATASPIFRLAPGDAQWTMTTGLAAGSNASNVVFDGSDDAYTVGAASATPATISLLKLTAGSLAWTKVMDVMGLGAMETCDGRYSGSVVASLADDHQGHLVLQCSSSFLRSQP